MDGWRYSQKDICQGGGTKKKRPSTFLLRVIIIISNSCIIVSWTVAQLGTSSEEAKKGVADFSLLWSQDASTLGAYSSQRVLWSEAGKKGLSLGASLIETLQNGLPSPMKEGINLNVWALSPRKKTSERNSLFYPRAAITTVSSGHGPGVADFCIPPSRQCSPDGIVTSHSSPFRITASSGPWARIPQIISLWCSSSCSSYHKASQPAHVQQESKGAG